MGIHGFLVVLGFSSPQNALKFFGYICDYKIYNCLVVWIWYVIALHKTGVFGRMSV